MRKRGDDIKFLDSYSSNSTFLHIFDPGDPKTYDQCYPNAKVSMGLMLQC
jgi:hypothetical protein